MKRTRSRIQDLGIDFVTLSQFLIDALTVVAGTNHSPGSNIAISVAKSWSDLNSMLLRSAIFVDVAFLDLKLRSTLTNRHSRLI